MISLFKRVFSNLRKFLKTKYSEFFVDEKKVTSWILGIDAENDFLFHGQKKVPK